MKELDAKEARFVEEYLIDLNPKRAAMSAGYAESTAIQKSYKWVCDSITKPHVFAAIQKAKEDRSERTKIDASWVLNRLAVEAEADVADLYNEDGSIKMVHEWPKIWRQGLVAGLDIEEIKVEGQSIGRVSKIKVSDRVKRLELIGRHVEVSAFKDTVEVNGKLSIADRLARAIEKLHGGNPQDDA